MAATGLMSIIVSSAGHQHGVGTRKRHQGISHGHLSTSSGGHRVGLRSANTFEHEHKVVRSGTHTRE